MECFTFDKRLGKLLIYQQPKHNEQAITWFENKLAQAIHQCENQYEKYRISDALMLVYHLVWDDFCAWYLELIKPKRQIDKYTYEKTISFFEEMLKLLHPFMPFISEEIWHLLRDRQERECIIISEYPKTRAVNVSVIESFEVLFGVVSQVRMLRNQQGIAQKVDLDLYVKKGVEFFEPYQSLLQKIAKVNLYFGDEEKDEKRPKGHGFCLSKV